ncbi:hypothetical protein [Ensifer aridi]|uniref:hypothetical protein n=1 Tax=Ensifer aridi TaxID=1708715 RepID=UPI000A117DEA|nr:hypothetical protein [Ensifer aridi]
MKISYEEFRAKLMDPSVSDEEISRFLKTVPSESGPFNPVVLPDPAKVQLDAEARFEIESALSWANGVARWRRQQIFADRVKTSKLPVVVSEGDSWFQFPFLLKDVVDQLSKSYLISSLDAAGDTARNMVYGAAEYMPELVRLKSKQVRAFLFSAAGNDVIGEDELGNPVLKSLLKTYSAGRSAAWHIDQGKLATVLKFLEEAYRDVIALIRRDRDFAELPIVIHGYDYAIPGGFDGDIRNPSWAKQDKWLGSAMKAKKILDTELQREIIRILIDALYDTLLKIAGDSNATYVYVADVRGTLSVGDWADEIHPTDKGFEKVANIFEKTLKKAGV